MINQILIDLDGVLTDMCLTAAKLFLPADFAAERVNNWPAGIKDITELLGINRRNFWKVVDNTPDFWDNLPKYEWADELMERLREFNLPLYICTSPSSNPNCASGKLRWMRKHKVVGDRDFVITPNKFLLANPYTVLIDDTDKQCDKFRLHGGLVVQFPQPWSQNHAATLIDGRMAVNHKVDYVVEELRRFVK